MQRNGRRNASKTLTQGIKTMAIKFTGEWALEHVSGLEWQQDNSGMYTIISRLPNGDVRIEIMSTEDNPARSFDGPHSDVRKQVMRWLASNVTDVSLEHAAYIGAELERAGLQTDYVQD
jgi:hypothetical protein